MPFVFCFLCNFFSVFRDCPPIAGSSLSSKDTAYISQGFPKQSLESGVTSGSGQHADIQDMRRSAPPHQLSNCSQVIYLLIFKESGIVALHAVLFMSFNCRRALL